jgi:transposase
MSTSILYHAFGLQGVKYQRTRYEGGEMFFEAEMTERLAVCPVCRSRSVIRKGSRVRRLRMVPVGRKRVWLDLTVHRLGCRACGAIRWPHLPFADPRRTVTHAFERYVMELLRKTTIADAAAHLGVGWDLVKDIHKRHLTRKYRHIPLKDVRAVAIDEFAVRKGHEYMTIVLDLESGRILHVAPGKSAASITPFLRVPARNAPNLRAVAMDMGPAYLGAVSRILPHVDIVLDRYHVTALVNAALEECRRGQQAELDTLGLKTLKGCRFLLLRNYEDLPKDKKARLNRLLKINAPLLTLHTMKEQLRTFWDQPNARKAAALLEAWCRDAMDSGIRPLMRVGKTLWFFRALLLNYFLHRITSARIEGTNNKIKTLKRQAYGFRDVKAGTGYSFPLHLWTMNRLSGGK